MSQEGPNLMLRSALARLQYWTERRTIAQAEVEADEAKNCERFIAEYNQMIEDAMKGCAPAA